MAKTKMMTALVLALAAGGCMTDGELDPELGEESAALTAPRLPQLLADHEDTEAISGNRATQCVLAGIDGDISAGSTQSGGAGAGVRRNGGAWELWVKPSSWSVHVKAMCFETLASTQAYSWTSNAASTQMKSTTGWRCFLTEVSTPAGGGLHTNSDVVQITSSGGYWRLGGSTTGAVTAKALCLEYTNDYAEYSVWAPANQVAGVNNPGVYDSGVGCGLTALNGHFDSSGTGVQESRVNLPMTSSYQWFLDAVNASGGAFRCIR